MSESLIVIDIDREESYIHVHGVCSKRHGLHLGLEKVDWAFNLGI
jgi:hypothetical protein